jgi:Bacteriophage capsid protein
MATMYKTPNGNSITANYRRWYPSDPNSGYTSIQNQMQNLSQGLFYETELGKAIIENLTSFVLGQGLTPMASPETEALDWTPEQVRTFQKQAETYFRLISNSVDFDYYGKDAFKELQKIALRSALIHGDFLLHRGYRKLGNKTVVPYVQIIPGNMVTNPNGQTDTKEYTGGIRYNKETGREVAYSVRVIGDDLSDTCATKEVKRYNSNGFKEFDLIKLAVSNPMQARGVPLLMTSSEDLLKINKLIDAQLDKAITQSIFTAFIKKEIGADTEGESVKDKLMGAMDEEPAPASDGQLVLAPGVVVEGNPGESVEMLESKTPSSDFANTLKSFIELAVAPTGLSYETLLGSYNASFSASRATINGCEKKFAIMRSEFINKVLEPIWEQVITLGIMQGAIEAPGFEKDAMTRKAILATTWTGVTPIQVDPGKEVNAYSTAIEQGLCTKEYAIRNLYGMDADEVAQRLKYEKELYAGALTPEQTADTENTQTENEEDNEEENDEGQQTDGE